jgi:hypothetical protein
MPINLDFKADGISALFLGADMAATTADLEAGEIGPGDQCYAVGLFRLRAGKGRNLPIVHTGNLAMMPDDELIPCQDWSRPEKTRLVEGFLVEMTNLDGLSGSPVFIRPLAFDFDPQELIPGPRFKTEATLSRANVQLLGIWQGSWDGESAVKDSRNRSRVPFGVGVVTPATKLLELLEQPEVASERDSFLEQVRLAEVVKPRVG